MLQLYTQTPKTELTAAQMLTAARNTNTRIQSQAGLIPLHPAHGDGQHLSTSYYLIFKSR